MYWGRLDKTNLILKINDANESYSADSRKKGLRDGAIIKAYYSIKKGLFVSSKKDTLNKCSRSMF